MGVNINLHSAYRSFADGNPVVAVSGETVGQCLDELVRLYPNLRDKIFDSQNRLLRTIEIYLNGESAYPDELARPTSDRDEIHISIILAGG